MSEQIDYLDFEVNIDKADTGDYVVRIASMGGRMEIPFTDPFTGDKRMIVRQTLTAAALRSSARVRSSSAPEIKTMKELGYTLFDNVVREQVREFYYQCLGQANQQGKGLRLRLVIDPALSDLPWEFLSTPQNEFLALDPKTPIVRFIELPTPSVPLKTELPLQILVVIASPHDQIPLEVDVEKTRIASALNPLQEQGLVKVSYIEGPDTWPRLIDALRPNETQILHYIGHGTFDEKNQEGVLVMEDDEGSSKYISSDLIRILLQGKTQLRLVVLNSCLGAQATASEPFASVAAGMVRAGVPAVIAMQFEVSDRAAEIIAGTFYKSLALNFPVDAALTEARRQIALLDRNSLEWATPVLFMQVPDGQLFNVNRQPEARIAALQKQDSSEKSPVVSQPASPSTAQSPAAAKPSVDLNTKAAESYQAGEDAALRGDWKAALTGYKGALLFVPNFRDAAKKVAYCERRNQCVGLYEQAQHLYADKKYTQVLETLNQIRNIDPRWVDSADLQTLAECGQIFEQAISALRAGNREGGADLLRKVLEKRQDFEDVVSRLENLAEGGTGLFGSTDPSAVVQTSVPPQQQTEQTVLPAGPAEVSPVAGQRIYELTRANPMALAEEIRQYFFRNGYQAQIFQQGANVVVQGKKEHLLRSALGMSYAATTVIEPTGTGFKVSVGGGKWIDKAAVAAFGIFVAFGFTVLTAGYGAAQQKTLENSIWQLIESHVVQHGGRRTA